MKTLLSPFLIVISFLSLQSFAQDNPLFSHLPPEASSVYHINVPVLASKIPWQDLMTKMPMKPKDDSHQKMMDIMKNPFATGINITKDFFITESGKTGADSVTITTIIFHLADSAKFVAFMMKQEPGLRYFNFPRGRAAGKGEVGVAWDKDLAVVTMVKADTGTFYTNPYPPAPKGKTAPATRKRPAGNYAMLAARKSLAALRGFDNSFYTTDATFKTGFSDDADMHAWAPQGAGLAMLTKSLMHKSPMGTQGLGKVMGMQKSNVHILMSLRFEAGRVILKSQAAYPADTMAMYAKLIGKPLNTDLIARLPKGKLLGMINFHLNIGAIGEMLGKGNNKAKVDSMLASKGLTMDDITRAFQGDFLIAGLIPEQQAGDAEGKSQQPSLYLVTAINDMASFNKLAVTTKLMKDPAATGDSAASQTLLDKMKMAYTLKDNVLVLSTSKANADAYANNTEKRSTDFIPALVKDNPFSLFIDIKSMGDLLLKMSKGGESSDKDKKMHDVLDMLDTFIIAGGTIQDGKVQTVVELKLTNSSENSLKSLVKLMQ
ncbi:MAG TPA: DUF4836 family protein [Puia sp.]|nr:DUF4836 family protein [Puia sp.]